LLIIPALALILVFSLLITAVMRLPGRPAALLSVYLLAFANIVLVGEITNSFYQLNNPVMWLALHAVLAALAGVWWYLSGKPTLASPWQDAKGSILPSGWRASLKSWPDLWVLGLGVAGAFLFSLMLLWIMPPNNNDSLATHMSRIGYWMQRGSFFPWPSPRVWQITYPVNMQLQMFWTVLFTGTDRIVEIVQWLGALAAVVAIFGLSRMMGASRPQAFFAGLIWATFPEIILESTTTQNDLVAGTLFAAMFYLLFLGAARRHRGALALSGLALGLCLGTKQTLFFLLPGLALSCVLILIYYGKSAWRSLWVWIGCGLAAFILIGGYMFVVNMQNFGHPMGPETAVNAQTGGQTGQSLLQNLAYNTSRLAYQSIDPTGLPDPVWGYSFKFKGLVVEKITQAIGFPVESPAAVAAGHQFVLRERYVLQEDAAWYGPLFSFLVLPALFYQLFIGIKRREPLRVSVFVLGLSFLVINAALRPGWDPFQGRYFIPVVILATALVAFIFRPGKGWGLLVRWAVVILALMIATNTFLYNSGKPVSGNKTLWGMNWLDRATIQSFYMRRPARLVEKYVPADSTMGLLTYGVYLEYPFFRADYSRRLVQIFPLEQAQNVDWLQENGIEYVVVQSVPDVSPVVLPGSLVKIAADEEWAIYTWAR